MGGLGLAVLNAISATTSENPVADRRDDNRVRYAQTPGAVASRLVDAVGLALRLGADPNVADRSKDTALHMLLRYPARRRILPDDEVAGEAIACTVRMLIEYRANVSAQNRKGERPTLLVQRLRDMGEHYVQAWQNLLATGREVQKPPALASQEKDKDPSKPFLPPIALGRGAAEPATPTSTAASGQSLMHLPTLSSHRTASSRSLRS